MFMDMILIDKTILELSGIADQMYKGDVELGIANMQSVIPNLVQISSWMDDPQQERWINDALKPALQAMEDNDGTMLADVITYEIITILDEMK